MLGWCFYNPLLTRWNDDLICVALIVHHDGWLREFSDFLCSLGVFFFVYSYVVTIADVEETEWAHNLG